MTSAELRPTDFAQRVGWTTHVLKAIFAQPFADLAPLLAPMIPPDAVVIDVGAHGGQFSKLFSRLAPRGRILAIEPSAYARSILGPALRWSRARNVEVWPVGVSDAPGRASLLTPIKRKGDLGFGLAHLGADASGRACVAHEVEITTLDALVSKAGLERLDFVKMDIEGWELNAVRGGLETLRRFSPPIYMEVNHAHLARAGATPEAVWATMAELGYAARSTPDQRPADAYAGPADYLWLPRGD
jgi:FkbM family methyltransferase